MQHTIINDRDGLTEVRAIWTELWRNSRLPVLPLSWEWFDAWWDSFGHAGSLGRDLELSIHLFEDAGVPKVLFPLMKSTRRFRGVPVQATCSLANGHSPLWDILVDKHIDTAESDQAIRTVIESEEADCFIFRRIADGSPLRHWIQQNHQFDGLSGDHETFRTPLIDTTRDWDDYIAGRSKKFRGNLRRKIRDFEKYDNLSVTYTPIEHHGDKAFSDLVAVSKNSWKVKVGNDLGSNHPGRRFLERLIDHIGPDGNAGVWFCRDDTRPIAYELHVKASGITYPIRADIDEDYRELSPGSVVEYFALKAVFEDEPTLMYDSCAADYWYFRYWTDKARLLHDMEVFPPLLKSRMLWALEYRVMPLLRRIRTLLQSKDPAASDR